MSNLLNIRTRFIGQSGRFDLAVDPDGGDYTDAGADEYIRRGQVRLEREAAWLKKKERRSAVLREGEYLLSVQGLRSIDYIRMALPDDSYALLDKKTDLEMEEVASTVYSEATVGEPKYWKPQVFKGIYDIAGDALFLSAPTETDTDITTTAGVALMVAAPNTWFAFKSSYWSHDSGVLTYVPATPPNPAILGQYISTTYSSRVTITIEALPTVSALGIAVGYWNGSAFTAIDSSSTLITETGKVTFTPSIAWNCIFVMPAKAGSADVGVGTLNFIPDVLGAGTISSVTVDAVGSGDAQLLFQPPADQEYTLDLFGLFYEPVLTADADTNFWTLVEPDLLLAAAFYELELAYDNMTRANQRLEQLKRLMVHAEMDSIEREWPDDEPLRVE